MDHLDFIITAETDPDSLSTDQYIDGVAGLVKSGVIQGLQGSWQRVAISLIDHGFISPEGDVVFYPTH